MKTAQFLRKAEENKAPETRAAGPSPLFSVLFAPGEKQLLTCLCRLYWFKYNRGSLAEVCSLLFTLKQSS